jgi:hypothetical protein
MTIVTTFILRIKMTEATNIPESTVTSVLTMLLHGDTRSIIGVLILAIMFLFYDRVRLIKELKQRDSEERTDRDALIELIEKHHKSSIETNEALYSVMIVLTRIEAKFTRDH